ncbi:hypothetical protein ACIQFZ_28875 [Streptomyces sp. NPDC093064]|uniref:hypothetical protein n=1 Tax=Streptomyces sp. NPDC093064 TaxID=3366020 RepID=UPI0038170945
MAASWVEFLSGIDDVVPGVRGGWRNAGEQHLDPGDGDSVTNWIRSAFEERVADGELELGVNLVADSNGTGGLELGITATVGGTSDLPTLKNSAVLKITRAGNEGFEQIPDFLRDLLEALVNSWDPDWADAGTYELWDAQEAAGRIPRRTPRTGLATYLSEGRARLAGDALAGCRTRPVGNGVVVDFLTESGEVPDLQRLVELDQALRSGEAFAPTPTDRARL